MRELTCFEIDLVTGTTGSRTGEPSSPVTTVSPDFGRDNPGQSDPGPGRATDLAALYAFIRAYQQQTGILLSPEEARIISGL